MKAEAPPIIGPLEFAGLKNKLILVECDEEDNCIQLMYDALKQASGVIHCVTLDDLYFEQLTYWYARTECSIYNIYKHIKNLQEHQPDHIIHRIDLMDLKLCKRVRGSQIKAYLSMLSPNILRGSNVIVTSCSDEHTIREIADVYLNLRK